MDTQKGAKHISFTIRTVFLLLGAPRKIRLRGEKFRDEVFQLKILGKRIMILLYIQYGRRTYVALLCRIVRENLQVDC
jgi:hypothetical protein